MLEERTTAEGPRKKNPFGLSGSVTLISNGSNTSANGDPPAGGPPTISGYEILGLLGRGGKGVVYKARQIQLNRLVALKMILSGPHASVSDVMRFMGEAEAVAHLHHPNIVQIYEVNQHEGLPYCVLEYVEGGSLQQKLRGAPVQPQEAANLIESLARAIHAAHLTGIVHRDLKPANVLLTRAGQPKITDFGLAKRLETGNSITGSGDVLGTPSYMSPEQADGMSGRVGPRSDVYALGAILYELLTGRPPFRGVTTMDTLRQVVSDEPVPPRRLQPKLPADLETICLKALTKEPNRRYATAEDLADDLRRYSKHEPIRARPAGTIERLSRWARRNPIIASLVSVTLATIVTAIAFLWVAWSQESRQRHLAEQQTQLAEVRNADNELDHGIDLCGQGEIHAGVLWMSRSLRHTPTSAHELERTIRASIAAWRVHTHHLDAILQPPPNDESSVSLQSPGRERNPVAINAVAYCKDGRHVVTAGFGRYAARLWSVDDGTLVRELRHDGPVFAVDCSPDSRYILTGSLGRVTGGLATLWDLATGTALREFKHSDLPVFAVGFSADGKRIVTGCRGGDVYVWDTSTGERLATFPHTTPVRSVAFHPNGRLIATGTGDEVGDDNAVRIWDIETRQLVVAPLLQRGFVNAVAFSPNGRTMAAACDDKAVYLWHGSRFTPLGPPLLHKDEAKSVAFSPDSRRVITGSRDKTARIWSASSREQIGAPLLHQDEVRAVAFGPDNTTVMVGCRDGTARLWRVNIQAPLPSFPHKDRVSAVAVAPGDRRIATGYGNGALEVWDAETSDWIWGKHAHDDSIEAIRFSPDGRFLMTLGADRAAIIWDAESKQRIHVLKHKSETRCASYSPNGRLLGIGCQDGSASVWDTVTGELVSSVRQSECLRAIVFHSDGSTFITGSEDGTAQQWDIHSGQARAAPIGQSTNVNAVAFSDDARQMLTGRKDGSVWLSDISTGESRALGPAHKDVVNFAAFAPGNKIAITCSLDGVARLWSTDTGNPIGKPLTHQPPLRATVFSPDGTTVLIGSQDGTAYIWSAETGEQIGPPIMQRDRKSINAAAFSTTGRILVTGSNDGWARVWRFPAPISGDGKEVELELAVQLGMELDDTNGLNFLSADEWKERKERWSAIGKR
jgi:WD40 repeat protein/serine/threonine protein kinase